METYVHLLHKFRKPLLMILSSFLLSIVPIKLKCMNSKWLTNINHVVQSFINTCPLGVYLQIPWIAQIELFESN